MDALAGLAFGIIVVNVIRGLGVVNPGDVAKNTVRSGILSSVLMAVIYVLVTIVGAQSLGEFSPSANGGEALALIAEYYFGPAGSLLPGMGDFVQYAVFSDSEPGAWRDRILVGARAPIPLSAGDHSDPADLVRRIFQE